MTTMTKKTQMMLQAELENLGYDFNDVMDRVDTFFHNFEPNRMRLKNTKLGGRTFHFDLPAIDSCLNCSMCKNTCYAMKSQTQYKQTKYQRNVNFELVKNDLQLLDRLLQAQLNDEKRRAKKAGQKLYIRIHVSGDFYSQEYVDLWTEIALTNPTVTFFGYSKVFDILDLSGLNNLPNVNIVNSLPAGQLNFGPVEYVKRLQKELGCPICPATLPENKNKEIHCIEHCDLCIRYENVVFVQH